MTFALGDADTVFMEFPRTGFNEKVDQVLDNRCTSNFISPFSKEKRLSRRPAC